MSTRRFWQIHLSTAVVLTLVSGAIMYANFRPERMFLVSGWGPPVSEGKLPHPIYEPYIHYGWPLGFYTERAPDHNETGWDATAYLGVRNSKLRMNCLYWLLILAATTVTLEFFVRRREARKP